MRLKILKTKHRKNSLRSPTGRARAQGPRRSPGRALQQAASDEERYRQFLDRVAERVASGKRFVDDLPQKRIADDDELASIGEATGGKTPSSSGDGPDAPLLTSKNIGRSSVSHAPKVRCRAELFRRGGQRPSGANDPSAAGPVSSPVVSPRAARQSP